MPQKLELFGLSSDMLIMLLGVVIILASITGFITDMVMGDKGFGVVGNGILAIFGAAIGVLVRNALLGQMEKSDLMVTAFIAASTGTLILLVSGLIKSWISNG